MRIVTRRRSPGPAARHVEISKAGDRFFYCHGVFPDETMAKKWDTVAALLGKVDVDERSPPAFGDHGSAPIRRGSDAAAPATTTEREAPRLYIRPLFPRATATLSCVTTGVQLFF